MSALFSRDPDREAFRRDSERLRPGTLLCGGALVVVNDDGEHEDADLYRVQKGRRELTLAILRRPDAVDNGYARERGIAAALGDVSGVLTAVEAGEIPELERPYVAYEFVRGTPLTVRIAEGMTPQQACAVIGQVAHTLAEVHARGIVHCDVRPENILCGFEQACVTNLRSAAFVGASPGASAGGVAGAEPYLAPEQVQGAAAAPSFDVYALTVVLYEALMGHVPTFWCSAAEVLRFKRDGELPPLSIAAHRVDLPSALARLVDRGLAADPGRRIASMAELEAGLATVWLRPREADPILSMVPEFAAAAVAREHADADMPHEVPATLFVPTELDDELDLPEQHGVVRAESGPVAFGTGAWPVIGAPLADDGLARMLDDAEAEAALARIFDDDEPLPWLTPETPIGVEALLERTIETEAVPGQATVEGEAEPARARDADLDARTKDGEPTPGPGPRERAGGRPRGRGWPAWLAVGAAVVAIAIGVTTAVVATRSSSSATSSAATVGAAIAMPPEERAAPRDDAAAEPAPAEPAPAEPARAIAAAGLGVDTTDRPAIEGAELEATGVLAGAEIEATSGLEGDEIEAPEVDEVAAPETAAPEVALEATDPSAETPVPSPVPRTRRAKAKAAAAACAAERKAADAARQQRAWEAVLVATESRRCWPSNDARIALRMQALRNLGRNDECVRAGAKSRNAIVRQAAEVCRIRREQEHAG